MNARTTTALAALGLAVLAGSAAADKASDTLNIAFDQELDTLNVYLNSSREGILFSRTVFDSLVYRDPETSEYLPNLATAWEWIDDTTLEVQLREGVTFHDGEPFDADDVVYTIEWVADEANGANPQRNVSWLAGAEKIDATTVRLLLDEPFPAALEYLAGPVVMLPNEYYEKVGPVELGPRTDRHRSLPGDEGRAREAFRAGAPRGLPRGQPQGRAVHRIDRDPHPAGPQHPARRVALAAEWTGCGASLRTRRSGSTQHGPVPRVERADSMRINWMTFDVSGRSGRRIPSRTSGCARRSRTPSTASPSSTTSWASPPRSSTQRATRASSAAATRARDASTSTPRRARQLLAEAGYPDGFETPDVRVP